MSDPERFEDVRAALRLSARGGFARDPRTPDCLDDDSVAALAEGALPDSDRELAQLHLSECHTCRSAVASIARAIDSPEVAAELARLDRPARLSRFWRAAAIAAAAVVLAVVVPMSVREPASPHRSAPITAAPAPAAVWPVGTVASVPSLRWTSVPGANRYRVTLFTADGTALFATQLRDTSTIVPDSVRLAPGVAYWWRVDARTGFDRWTESALNEFTVANVVRP